VVKSRNSTENLRRGSNLETKRTLKKYYWLQGLALTGNQTCFPLQSFTTYRTCLLPCMGDGWGSLTAIPK
jgi:hypothetical protein